MRKYAVLFLSLLFSLSGFASSEKKEMLFPPFKNGIQVSAETTAYDFSHQDHFLIGGKRFDYSQIKLETRTLRVSANRAVEQRHFYHRLLGFNWPQDIVSGGDLIFISPVLGRKLYSVKITKERYQEWLSAPQRIHKRFEHIRGRGKLKHLGEKLEPKKFDFGMYPVPEKLKSILSKTFRFCVDHNLKQSRVRLCSPFYRLAGHGRFIRTNGTRKRSQQRIKNKKGLKPAKVFLNGEPAPEKGVFRFHRRQLSFKAEMPNGFSLSVRGELIGTKVAQVLQSGDVLKVQGHGERPMGATAFDDSFRLFEKLGWKDTIQPKKNFWKLDIPRSRPFISVLNAGMKDLGQRFHGKEFPSEKDVLSLENPTVSTYNKKHVFHGMCLRECQLKVVDSDDLVETDGKKFTWTAELKSKNKAIQKNLKVIDGPKVWVAEQEVFRASSSELSARFSVLATLDATTSVLGEVSASHWFESALGWQNYYLSKQRWGISARHFQTLTDIVIATGFESLKWANTNVDIKYRFKPGVWGLSETVGFVSSYQNTTLGQETVPVLGGGLFWAKSMPEVFDRILNWIPGLRYPKWVDMEIIYYPLNLDAKNTPNGIWNVNFHGKVLWSEAFFGEAGFGMRNVDFFGGVTGFQFQFLTAYITLGLGLQF